MKILEKEFVSKKFKFKQIAREGNVAIYERCHVESEHPHWEVIIIKKVKARVKFGEQIPETEIYPNCGQWGQYGWTCVTKERAYEKMSELLTRMAQKPCVSR